MYICIVARSCRFVPSVQRIAIITTINRIAIITTISIIAIITTIHGIAAINIIVARPKDVAPFNCLNI